MRIGELAKVVGLKTTTIRYYESKGLLPPTSRTPANYRTYGDEDAQRLQLIKRAKRAGLLLQEIKPLFGPAGLGSRTAAEPLDQVLLRLDSFSRQLETLRAELARLLEEAATVDDCRAPGGRICAIIEGAKVGLSEGALSRLASVLQRRALQRAT